MDYRETHVDKPQPGLSGRAEAPLLSASGCRILKRYNLILSPPGSVGEVGWLEFSHKKPGSTTQKG